MIEVGNYDYDKKKKGVLDADSMDGDIIDSSIDNGRKTILDGS